MDNPFFCRGDNQYHYISEIPSALRPYVNHQFSSGGITGDDYKKFERAFKSAVKKRLPEGYQICRWNSGHYECSAVIRDCDGRYIYVSISDVRFFPNEWLTNILIRTMKHEKDWTGGSNHYTTLFGISEDIQRLHSEA